MDKNILNFKKWLDKINVNNNVKSINEKYFDNAPGINYKFISVELTAATIEELRQLETKINKYMKRYNIEAFLRGRYNYNYYLNCYSYAFNARTAAASKISENYYYYVDQAKEFFEIAHHVYIVMGIIDSHKIEFNQLTRSKINYYGNLYAESLKAGENAA